MYGDQLTKPRDSSAVTSHKADHALLNNQQLVRVLWKGGSSYAELMLHIYDVVMVAGLPNYIGCMLPAPVKSSHQHVGGIGV